MGTKTKITLSHVIKKFFRFTLILGSFEGWGECEKTCRIIVMVGLMF